MAVELSSAIWAMPKEGLNPSMTLVLLSLADQMNDHGLCWPSHAYTASRTGLSEKQVQRHVKALKALGLIRVIRNENGGKPGQTPFYQATGLRTWLGQRRTTGPTQGRGRGVTEEQDGSHGGARTGPSDGTLTVIEPSKNQGKRSTTNDVPFDTRLWSANHYFLAASMLGTSLGHFDKYEREAEFFKRIREMWSNRPSHE